MRTLTGWGLMLAILVVHTVAFAKGFNLLDDLGFWLEHRYTTLEKKELQAFIERQGFDGARFFFKDLDRWLTFDVREYLHDWHVRVRLVSLHYRDLKHRPDTLAAKVLKDYEAKLSRGESISPRIVVDQRGDEIVYRYFIPIYTKKECLDCHGTNYEIPPAYQAELHLLYPEDRARGLKPGDLRGAISLEIPSEAVKYFSLKR